MTLREWLQSPLYINRDKPLVVERLAELIACNSGRFEVSGWGCTSSAGLYGRSGLEQGEALELIALQGTCNGFLLAGAGTFEQCQQLIEAEWAKQEQLLEQNR